MISDDESEYGDIEDSDDSFLPSLNKHLPPTESSSVEPGSAVGSGMYKLIIYISGVTSAHIVKLQIYPTLFTLSLLTASSTSDQLLISHHLMNTSLSLLSLSLNGRVLPAMPHQALGLRSPTLAVLSGTPYSLKELLVKRVYCASIKTSRPFSVLTPLGLPKIRRFSDPIHMGLLRVSGTPKPIPRRLWGRSSGRLHPSRTTTGFA